MGSWWFVGVVLVGVLIPWPYCPFDLTGPNRYEPPGGDPSSLSHWQSGRSIQDRSVHTSWVILDWVRLTLSYVPSLSLTDPNPLSFGGESGYERVLSLVDSVFHGCTSSYFLALNHACPVSELLVCLGWFESDLFCFRVQSFQVDSLGSGLHKKICTPGPQLGDTLSFPLSLGAL